MIPDPTVVGRLLGRSSRRSYVCPRPQPSVSSRLHELVDLVMSHPIRRSAQREMTRGEIPDGEDSGRLRSVQALFVRVADAC